jgi:3-hydroxyacyl-CoA dehydrogenase / 3-hydroxy-2-methylbutyryl-CoA dehydrogenase
MKLKDAVAIITGGGSGLGEATGRDFAAAGARIVVLDLANSPGPKVAESFGEKGLFVAADVVSGDAVEAGIAEAVKRFGSIHIAVNCAGVGRAQRTVAKDGPHSLDLFAKVVQINLIGTFNVIRSPRRGWQRIPQTRRANAASSSILRRSRRMMGRLAKRPTRPPRGAWLG